MNTQEIEKLKNEALNRKSQTLSIDRFCVIPNQKATVCRHFPCELGCYHNHNFFEINYVKKGHCVNFIEDRAIYMSEGSFILLHTDVFHTVYAPDESCIIYNVLLRKEWFLDTVKSYPLPNTAMGRFLSLAGNASYPEYVYSAHTPDEVGPVLTSLFETREQVSLITESQILFCLAKLMEKKESILSDRQRTSDEMMLSILSFINNNFQTVTMDTLSAHLGYSKTHICRLFRQHLHKSFGETVRSIRREHAEFFLRSTDHSISEISCLVGYENPEHFCRIFKKDHGISPSEYRKKYSIEQSKRAPDFGL